MKKDTKIDENLNEIFNIEPVVEVKQLPSVVDDEEDEDIDEIESDFKLARDTLKGLIKTNNDAIGAVNDIAVGYENPRGFEVLGQLIKAQTDIVKELLDTHKKKKDLNGKQAQSPTSIDTQNNIVFSGSTSDLLKALSAKDANE